MTGSAGGAAGQGRMPTTASSGAWGRRARRGCATWHHSYSSAVSVIHGFTFTRLNPMNPAGLSIHGMIPGMFPSGRRGDMSSDMKSEIIHGDCLEVMRKFPDNCFDSVVTDPPAGIAFMSREWDDFRRARNPADAGRDNVFGRTSRHGPEYGRGEREAFTWWLTERMTEVVRVLKPGGHALVWSIPRTSHWTAWALEDAGFEIRDCILHIFGSGFPKSLAIDKAIDRAAGAERDVTGVRGGGSAGSAGGVLNMNGRDMTHGSARNSRIVEITAPATEEAARWEGFGTALKPAQEIWWLCRKPLAEKTIAASVLEWGTGGLNIDGTRVTISRDDARSNHGDNISGTSLSPTGDRTSRTPNKQHQASSVSSLAGHNDLPPSVLSREMNYPQSPDSPGDYQISPYSYGEHAPSAEEGDRASAQQSPDVRELLYPDTTCGHSPQNQSMPYNNSTALDIQNASNTAGRWPPNILLTHDSRCKSAGTRRVRSSHDVFLRRSSKDADGNTSAAYGAESRAEGTKTPTHGDADGLETMQAWNCVPGCPVAGLDAQSGGAGAHGADRGTGVSNGYHGDIRREQMRDPGSGGASRFYPQFAWDPEYDLPFMYQAKAPKSERPAVTLPDGRVVRHSTVKPLALMRWLVRLVTPPGGIVLDPFAGSGSTAQACLDEGFRYVLIEREEDYIRLISQRLSRRPPSLFEEE